MSCESIAPDAPIVIGCDELTELTVLSDDPNRLVDYLINCDDYLLVADRLVIEAGTIVEFSEGSGLMIEPDGSIEVRGTDTKQVILRGEEIESGYWAGILIQSQNPQNHITHARIDAAGIVGTGPVAAISLLDGWCAIEHSVISRGEGLGIFVNEKGRLIQFEGNTIAQMESWAMGIPIKELAQVSATNLFTRNAPENPIVVAGELQDSIVIQDPGVGIEFESIWIGDQAVCEIEAGCEFVALESSSNIVVEDQAQLIVRGTPVAPVQFRGAESSKGYWIGILFAGSQGRHQLSYFSVQHATDGIALLNGGARIDHGTIRDNQNCGIRYAASIAPAVFIDSTTRFLNNSEGDICVQ